jgi:hypothetical protein
LAKTLCRDFKERQRGMFEKKAKRKQQAKSFFYFFEQVGCLFKKFGETGSKSGV